MGWEARVLLFGMAFKCVPVYVVEGVHKGLGETWQCIILLHLLYSRGPLNRETEEVKLCWYGGWDSNGPSFHSFTLVMLLSNAHFDVSQITPASLLY